jgi:hypothetical protein
MPRQRRTRISNETNASPADAGRTPGRLFSADFPGRSKSVERGPVARRFFQILCVPTHLVDLAMSVSSASASTLISLLQRLVQTLLPGSDTRTRDCAFIS